MLLCWLAVSAGSGAPALGQGSFGVPFIEDEFRAIGDHGFGERGNSRVWAVEYFKDHLYIGTNFNFLCVVRAGTAAGNSDNPRVPVECADRLIDNDLRARLYRYDPRTNVVELVYISPTTEALLSDGSRVEVAVDAGYRALRAFTEPDGTEALYVGTFTTTRVPQPPARILRSTDGRTFTEVPVDFPNRGDVRSYRSFTVFNGRFYTIALGDQGETTVIESHDPASGVFQVINGPGYGADLTAFELQVFAGFLYIGAFTQDGFELIKTQGAGTPPYVFQSVLTEGAYRGSKSQAVLSMGVFRDHLYVGSGIFFGSLTLDPNFQFGASEILRVAADDTWELIVGEERATPDGYKSPLSGRAAGFGNPFIGYLWQLCEHDGVLYAGTLDTSILAQYGDAEAIPLDEIDRAADHPVIADVIEAIGPSEIAEVISAVEGGFDLWSSTDGVNWELVSRTGFGDGFNWGVRTLISTPHGLFLGTDNPFYGLRLFRAQPLGTDTDGDSIPDADDNCPLDWNLDQSDTSENGIGDVCNVESDGAVDDPRNSSEPGPSENEPPRPEPEDPTAGKAPMCGAVGWVLPFMFCTLTLWRTTGRRR